MEGCRNCGSAELVELGFIGRIAPFFLKRVLRLEMRVPVSPHPLKELLRKIGAPARGFLSKIYSKEAYLEMQICRTCSFVQAKHPFPEDQITQLYVDYRSDSYNRERIHYEPTYAAIASRVGADPAEISIRMAAAVKFLRGRLEIKPGFTMLDYGGADGRFLPNLAPSRYVYEISDIAPVEGVTRIAAAAELGLYSYIHLAHVLEHVVQPLELVRRILQYLEPEGYLYLEVPQEIPDDSLRRLQQGNSALEVTVHEHINYYSVPAVTRLLEAAGLTVVAVEAERVSIGWANGIHVRTLGRRSQIPPKASA